MIFIIAILAISLVSTNAAVQQPFNNYEIEINSVIQEAEQIAIDSAKALVQQFDAIVADPFQQVEEVVGAIESRKEDNEVCVVVQEPVLKATVDTMHNEMGSCGLVAAKSSAEIMSDVSRATHQLVFDGLDVARTYKKCKKYKNSVLRSSCYTRLSIKAALFMKNSRKSIKTIKDSTNNRIPAVFTDADQCTHSASEKAIEQLNYVNTEIDSCISRA